MQKCKKPPIVIVKTSINCFPIQLLLLCVCVYVLIFFFLFSIAYLDYAMNFYLNSVTRDALFAFICDNSFTFFFFFVTSSVLDCRGSFLYTTCSSFNTKHFIFLPFAFDVKIFYSILFLVFYFLDIARPFIAKKKEERNTTRCRLHTYKLLFVYLTKQHFITKSRSYAVFIYMQYAYMYEKHSEMFK